MEYKFEDIEPKWQQFWDTNKTFRAENQSNKPKYYVLDMFPYPSGAGLHVGHPLGYIASDIMARYKRLQGFNVLHPMGFDAFGLPAEQYAIQTGQHPAVTTEKNIQRYIEQLKNIGFAYDWDRAVNTSDPEYYKWTQWIFLQLFHHWYDPALNKARPISELEGIFETSGNRSYDKQTISGNVEQKLRSFGAEEWKSFTAKEKSDVLMCYRLAYQSYAYVNWCEALGTVLANDEVKDGVSERGGHPVERRQMRQWFLRITAYAERLNADLDDLEWSDSMKEMQRNWIGRSEGARVRFETENGIPIDVFTTRPDTIFGVSFLVLAPESELAQKLISDSEKSKCEVYINEAKNRSERERMADVKNVSGVFTGAFAIHPFTGKKIPVWISDYVLAGYGTGAVMAVPAHDSRDYRFAKHFSLPILQVIEAPDGSGIEEAAYEGKAGKMINSDFLDGLDVKESIGKAGDEVEKQGFGEKLINYRLRDANFSRQRYWGEPFPIYYENGIPKPLPETELPLKLPLMDDFKPTGNPDGPLAKLDDWKYNGFPLETDTMPGFAGSSWYFLRYTDPKNAHNFASKDVLDYWKDVDLYIGGTEHAVGHLLYSRFWNKFLYDLGLLSQKEPFRKLVNQGMIGGESKVIFESKLRRIIYSNSIATPTRINNDGFEWNDFSVQHIEVSLVDRDGYVSVEKLKLWRPEYADYTFYYDDENIGRIECAVVFEKMSKSKFNVVNPDDIISQYGADTLRIYEMFLGPVEQSKPWNTSGIEGVFRFLRKFWNLFHDKNGWNISEEKASPAELKVLHKTIKQVRRDSEAFSFNTCVSAFMICVNELQELKCNKRSVLKELTILLSPFAPHITEELWSLMGNKTSVSEAQLPNFDESYLTESSFSYPVSINGKMRFNLDLPLEMPSSEMEQILLADERTQKWLEGKSPKKVIIVPKRIINIVL